MKFEGEHLLPGQWGHFFVIAAFIASLLSVIGFYIASRQTDLHQKKSWLLFARNIFFVQAICVLVIFSLIFYICFNHYYEYMYAYKHASKELEYKFLLACIWEGQEGSFLLWTIWHAVLGTILLFNKNEGFKNQWCAPLMTIISFAQFFLLMMILGIYFFGTRIGSSPFALTRNEIAAPIFGQANYLSFIKDGMGLNVLLRNYWMVIHPPILFLGFASTIVPFAFAYAGMQTRKFGDWVKPVLPWALFSAGILGVGIMMGGKWAYESLSFGGYWAWDPVENASMVPWLILIAGIHTMLIYKSTGHALKATYLFAILSFIFVLYSTFLTRTGILGDTSVHAFTEAGMAMNVLIGIFVLSFALPVLGLFFFNQKNIPSITKEEETTSREFWMFIGSLVFFMSALFIILITSIPVYSKTPLLKDLIIKIHGGPLALPEDAAFLYNKIMIIVAIIIGWLTAVAQYLKYKSTPGKYLRKNIAYPLIISLIVSTTIFIFYPFTFHKHGIGFLAAIYIAFFFMVYAAIANALYISIGLKNKFKHAGGSISHAGFALMIAGVLISSSNKEVISNSTANGINLKTGIDPMTKQEDDPSENLTLIRDIPVNMGDYKVTYTGDSAGHEKGRKFFELKFEAKDSTHKNTGSSFILHPDVYIMKDNNMSSNPDTKSYLTKDIFTYITYAINEDKNTDTAQFNITELAEGDTGFYSNGYFILNQVIKNPSNGKYHFNQNDIALMADISIISKEGMHYKASPLVQVDSLGVVHTDDTIYAQNLFVKFMGVSENRKVKIGIKESSQIIDFVTVKTYLFPYINLVWLGLIIMAIGILFSMTQRASFNTLQTSVTIIFVALGLFFMFLLAN